MSLPFRPRTLLCALSVSALAACGGGGGDSSSNNLDALANQMPAGNEVIILANSSEAQGASASDRRQPLAQLPNDDVTSFTSGTPPVTYTIGYRNLSSEGGLSMKFGHLKDDKTKFFVHAEMADSDTSYDCISSAWSDAEKAAMLAAYGTVPATCGSEIKFEPGSNRLTMTRATLPSASGARLVLNVNTTIAPINFSAATY